MKCNFAFPRRSHREHGCGLFNKQWSPNGRERTDSQNITFVICTRHKAIVFRCDSVVHFRCGYSCGFEMFNEMFSLFVMLAVLIWLVLWYGRLVELLVCFRLCNSLWVTAVSFFLQEGSYFCWAICLIITLCNFYLRMRLLLSGWIQASCARVFLHHRHERSVWQLLPSRDSR